MRRIARHVPPARLHEVRPHKLAAFSSERSIPFCESGENETKRGAILAKLSREDLSPRIVKEVDTLRDSS